MHPKLSHLTSEQVNEMMTRYYDGGEKVDVLISEFGLDVYSSTFVATFPRYIHDDLSCDFCDGVKLISKRMSRDRRKWAIGPPFCPSCNHREGDEKCRCNFCLENEADINLCADDKRREIIKNEYKHYNPFPQNIAPLSLKDALYLLSTSRHSLSEDFYSIRPYEEHPPLLAPTLEYRGEIVQHLYSKGLVSICTDSDINAFVFDDDLTKSGAYYPSLVTWKFLPSMTDGEKRVYMSALEALVKSKDWPEAWEVEKNSLWHHLAKYECFEHYSFLLRDRNYEQPDFGPKTHTVFEALLENYAVSQIFNLSWQAVRDTTDYNVRMGLPRYHAKNNFIGAIQRKGEKALAEGWEVRCSRRDFNCPQTVVSSTFFDVFLGLGQSAFDTPPSLQVT